MEIVTGCRGQAHITAAQAGAFNAGILGTGAYVLENGEQLAATVITNNLIRISDGDIVMQGRHVTIDKGTYEEVQIANGLSGMNRNDLIVVRYSKESTTGIEDAKLVVIQGVSTEGIAQDPEYIQGSILSGDLVTDMPLYRIKLNGLTIEMPEQLFQKQESLHSFENRFLNMVYPVGSIYMSVNAVNPSNLFGGTWVVWGSGRVPVGVNTSETEFSAVEKTGGAKTHVLTTAQLPVHTHTFTGTAVNTGNENKKHTHIIPALSGATSHSGQHNHIISGASNSFRGEPINGVVGTNADWNSTEGQLTRTSGNHSHSVTTNASNTGDNSSNHIHSVTAKGTNSNTGSGSAHNNLQPYITCYMWKRTA